MYISLNKTICWTKEEEHTLHHYPGTQDWNREGRDVRSSNITVTCLAQWTKEWKYWHVSKYGRLSKTKIHKNNSYNCFYPPMTCLGWYVELYHLQEQYQWKSPWVPEMASKVAQASAQSGSSGSILSAQNLKNISFVVFAYHCYTHACAPCCFIKIYLENVGMLRIFIFLRKIDWLIDFHANRCRHKSCLYHRLDISWNAL